MHSTMRAGAATLKGGSGGAPRLSARGSRLALLAIANVVAILTVAGIMAAGVALLPGGSESADTVGPIVGDTVATSFGTITVQHIETIDGLTKQDLGGMSHGIADLVQTDEAQVLVSVLTVNGSDDPVLVEPGQYALFVEGSTDALVPTSSTIKPLTLQPGSSVEASMIFVAPLSGADISVGYSDPGGSVIVIPAGGLDEAPPGAATDDHNTDDHNTDDHNTEDAPPP